MSQDEKELEEQLQRVQRRMDRLFSEVMPSFGVVTARQQRNWRPPTDVYETEESVIVKVEVAGMFLIESYADRVGRSPRSRLQTVVSAVGDTIRALLHRSIPALLCRAE